MNKAALSCQDWLSFGDCFSVGLGDTYTFWTYVDAHKTHRDREKHLKGVLPVLR